MEIRRIKETCIYVSDLEATKAFYVGKLRLAFHSMVPNRHVFFRAGDSMLLCFLAAETEQEKNLPPHGAVGSVHFAFEVSKDHYQVALRLVREAGITILHEHTWGHGFQSFYFHDPDGNLVEMVEEGMWERSK